MDLNLIFMVLIFAVLYFFMIRPQQQLRKKQEAFQAELEKGDEVVMACGIIGKINKMEEDSLTLETSSKTYLRVTRNSVSREMTEALTGKKE